MTSKRELAIAKATLLIKEAYKVLCDGGFSAGGAFEKLQGILLEVWNAGMGL